MKMKCSYISICILLLAPSWMYESRAQSNKGGATVITWEEYHGNRSGYSSYDCRPYTPSSVGSKTAVPLDPTHYKCVPIARGPVHNEATRAPERRARVNENTSSDDPCMANSGGSSTSEIPGLGAVSYDDCRKAYLEGIESLGRYSREQQEAFIKWQEQHEEKERRLDEQYKYYKATSSEAGARHRKKKQAYQDAIDEFKKAGDAARRSSGQLKDDLSGFEDLFIPGMTCGEVASFRDNELYDSWNRQFTKYTLSAQQIADYERIKSQLLSDTWYVTSDLASIQSALNLLIQILQPVRIAVKEAEEANRTYIATKNLALTITDAIEKGKDAVDIVVYGKALAVLAENLPVIGIAVRYVNSGIEEAQELQKADIAIRDVKTRVRIAIRNIDRGLEEFDLAMKSAQPHMHHFESLVGEVNSYLNKNCK